MKARLPKGMGGGPQNMNAMIKQAQKMQEDMENLQADLDTREYDVSAGGGAVKIHITGKLEVTSIEVSEAAADMEEEDREMLCDLLVAAVNEAIKTVNDTNNAEREKITGSLSIPGLM